MFEVLAFVYENYYADHGFPEPAHLHRKLNAEGFDKEEISEAIEWLSGLSVATRCARPACANTPTVVHSTWLHLPSGNSTRVYSLQEQNHLGPAGLGYLSFMEASGILAAPIREVVMDRVMAVARTPITLEYLKIIILLVYWTFGYEPDALVLDELCDDAQTRVVH
nr:DUF494 domain-containing protein [uncultured Rhodoferax sp.]